MQKPEPSAAASGEARTSIYHHMIRGSTWALALTWTLRGIGFVNTVVLARLLAPHDFGLVAMASLAFGLLDTLVNFGTGLLLIRQKDATREQCDTAWTISLLRGCAIALALVAGAPFVASYFNEPLVVPIVYVVAFNAALQGGLSVGLVLMRKELDFAREFRYTVFARLFTVAATLLLAFLWRSYWALVIGSTLGGLFQLWLSFYMHPYRPRWSLARAGEYLRWSTAVVPLNVLFYLASRVDSFVVGRAASATVLGFYNVAADLSTMMTSDLTAQVGRALYPSYARLTDRKSAFRDAFLNSFSMLAILNIAFGLGLYSVGSDFIIVVLGEKWRESVPLLQWLAIAGLLRGLTQSISGNVLMVAGKEGVAVLVMLARFVALACGASIGAYVDGARGVAIGITLGMAVSLPIGMGTVARTLDMRVTDILRASWRPVLAGLGMVAALSLARGMDIDSRALSLVLQIALGAAVFIALLLGAWRACGSPPGPERALINLVMARLRRPASQEP